MKVIIETLETHIDERGVLFEILKDIGNEGNIKHLYFSTSNPGAIRGNHYHIRKLEWFMVPRGIFKLLLRDNITGEEKTTILSGDKPTIVKIFPNVSHAIQNIGDSEGLLIAISSEVFNPKDPDTYSVKLI